MNIDRTPWRSLKTRVTLSVLLVLVLGSFLLMFYASRMLHEDMQRLLGEQQLATVSFMATEVDLELDGRMRALDTVATSISPAMLADPAVMRAVLERHPLLVKQFNGGVLAYRTDGIAIVDVPPVAGRAGSNHLHIDTVATALKEGRASISRPLMGKALRAPVFGLSVPIRDEEGMVVGALSGVINLGKPNFFDKLQGSHRGKVGNYAVVDRHNGLVVNASDKGRILQLLPGSDINDLIDGIAKGKKGMGVYKNAQGTEMLASVRHLPFSGWYMVAFLPLEDAFSPVRAMQTRILWMAGALLLLAGSLIWWILQRQLSPLQAAARTLTALAGQPQTAPMLTVRRNDEIGELITSFNRLLAVLALRGQALKDSEYRMSEILANVDACIYLKDMQGRYLFANRSLLELFAVPLEQLVGQEDAHFFAPDAAAQCYRSDRLVLDQGQVVKTEETNLTLQGRSASYLSIKLPLRNAAGEIYALCGISTDITERKQAERYEQFRSSTLEQLVKGISLAQSLESIVRGVEQVHPDMLCSILLLDAEGRHLGQGIAPSLPDFYMAAIDGVEIGVGVGSCGTAAATGQRVVVEEIKTHPYWAPYAALAARAGLAACWSQPILSAGGKVLGTFAVYARIAHVPTGVDLAIIEQSAQLASIAIERKQAEEKLQLAASVFTHAGEGIAITMADGSIIDINDAFSNITGYSRADALGQDLRLLKSGRHPATFYTDMWQQLTGPGEWSGEIWNRHKNGKVYAEMLKISAVRDTTGQIINYVALFSDISALKAYQSQLEHMAHYDALTRLPNRILLAERLRQGMPEALRHGKVLAVAYLDLDGFKAVNDGYGHEVGDQLLVALASGMQQALREGDILARLGGDEFVMVLHNLPDIDACKSVLVRVLAAAARTVAVDGHVLQVSASLGVTFYPQQEDVDADQLLRQADQAMYQAKLGGRNRFHLFDTEQDRSIRDHHESLERIQQALNADEFVLYYQPKVNMRTGAVIGAEALIRWQHPALGLLPPAAFLPAIENHSLSVAVGEWVIERALCEMLAWRKSGLAIPVSVNVGARQLQQPDFAQRLAQTLARHPEVKANDLELELLETSAMEDLSHVSRLIEDCRQLGVSFAMDDFGTGYSSLTYLKRLPVSLLKIDQSFVRGMLEDGDDLAILQGIIGLARAFGREVIAEGVETVAHGEMLLAMGCEQGQGYGIARPMPGDALPAWASHWPSSAKWGKSSDGSLAVMPPVSAVPVLQA
ncbi:EAL domain-containing protein [Craterilacuibacter sp.]|uniref:bifunctional diguanylate cyclase/phosphodiesterase n=1 Tax=Craterilacuibacter sp. TaxID=2870909 RepID=UPI003F3AD523